MRRYRSLSTSTTRTAAVRAPTLRIVSLNWPGCVLSPSTQQPIRSFLWAAVVTIGIVLSPQASVANDEPTESRAFFSCARNYQGISDLARSDASRDLYHGLAFLGGAASIRLAGSPTRRWSGTNGFDTGIRDKLRLGSTNSRQDASLASDLGLVFSAALLPLASIGSKFAKDHDCVETWDMFTDVVESFGLTIFVPERGEYA